MPSEFHREAIGTAVAEAPGRMEVARSRPLVGDSGLEYEAALTALGRKRNSLHVINALSCRPPDNELARVMSRLKTLNDKREAAGLEKLPPPITCCAPRVEHDFRHANKIAPGSGSRLILMGKIALEAITGRRSPILEIRGAPITSMPGVLIMPTTHPAFVLRVRRWTKVFRADIGRAFRWFETGKIDWIPPRVLRRPTPEQFRRWLFGPASRPRWRADASSYAAIIYDTETTMEGGPMWNRLRCTGWGQLDEDERGVGVLYVPVLSVDGVHRFYSVRDEDEIREIERELFADAAIEKWGWNSNYFDALIKGEYLALDPTRRLDGAHVTPFRNFVNCCDGIVNHRAVESELPHKLGFAGSAYTDVPGAWKQAHTAVETSSDVELADYNVIDIGVTARILPPIREAVVMREQEEVVRRDYKLQEIARGLHRNGVPVHEPTRAAWEIKFRNEAGVRDETTGYVPANTLLKKLCDIAGEPDLNPRSTQQLRALIFSRWGLTPAMDPEGRKPLLTKAGYPSTSNAAILELRRRGDASPRAIEFIDTLRKYRKKSKLLGTYIMRLAPREARASFTEMDAARALEMEEGGDASPAAGSEASLTLTDDGRIETAQRLGGANFIDPSGGLFDENEEVEEGRITKAGRVHANYNAHTVKTGRFSVTRPGMQTFPRELRDLFRARDGWTFVIADKDQIELRHTVARANAKRYLEVFAQKKEKVKHTDGTWTVRGDPHSHAAASTFGKRFTLLEPETPDWERIRDFTKRLVYASSYVAQAPTIHRVITSVEDMNGNLLYADMSLLDVAELRTNWLRENPEIEPWWGIEVQEYQSQGYRCDAVWGRRCDFLDGENINEIANFDEQAGCAAIVHDDTFELLKAIPFEKWGPYSGLIMQDHDKLIIECPETQAEWVKGVMNECMNRHVQQIPNIKFTAKPKISKTFKGG